MRSSISSSSWRTEGILHHHHHHHPHGGGGGVSIRDGESGGGGGGVVGGGGGGMASTSSSPPNDPPDDHTAQRRLRHSWRQLQQQHQRHQHQQQNLQQRQHAANAAAATKPPLGVSLSGNFLLYVQIEEDVELDKDETRQLARSDGAADDDGDYDVAAVVARTLHDNSGGSNDTSTIGSSPSMMLLSSSGPRGRGRRDPSKNNGGDGSEDDVADITAIRIYSFHDGPASEIDRMREKLEMIVFSPPFRRFVYLGLIFVLIAAGVVLTMENFMSVRTEADWIEPRSSASYAPAHGGGDEGHRAPSSSSTHGAGYDVGGGDGTDGGVDWTFGDDAPKPIPGASVAYDVDNNLANWARGTMRVPSSVEMDGYGSVSVHGPAMYADVPYFWGLPFAGGSLGSCLGLVQAGDGRGLDGDGDGDGAGAGAGAGVGVGVGAGADVRLSTVLIMGKKYLNVDLSTPGGIARAVSLGLGSSGMADVVHSPLLHEASGLFSPSNMGRLFVAIRHPAEREFARFRYLRRWDHGKLMKEGDARSDAGGMSYEEFAESDYVADDWMTRTLVGKGADESLTAVDMHTAKEILRRKAVIGLYSDLLGAMRHYARHFGWDNASNGGRLTDGTLACFESSILEGMGRETHGTADLVDEDALERSAPWRRIMERNKFDWELYAYSQHLYTFHIALS